MFVFLLDQRMDKRPFDIVENDFDGIIGVKFKGSLVGSEGKLIICFHAIDLKAIWPIVSYVAWGGVKTKNED